MAKYAVSNLSFVFGNQKPTIQQPVVKSVDGKLYNRGVSLLLESRELRASNILLLYFTCAFEFEKSARVLYVDVDVDVNLPPAKSDCGRFHICICKMPPLIFTIHLTFLSPSPLVFIPLTD